MVWGKTHPGKVYHFVQVYLPLRELSADDDGALASLEPPTDDNVSCS